MRYTTLYLFLKFFSILLLFEFLSAQDEYQTTHPEREFQAYRIEEEINIDGVLDENIWQNPAVSGFTQKDPDEGASATFKTEVWVGYDSEALYIAARMYDPAPDSIVGRLGRRDAYINSDWFKISLDTYHDHRSGFSFSINPSGSIQDEALYNDSWSDDSWDGVWEGAVRIDKKGWTVEIRIPYSQLRFPERESHIWGINFRRFIQRRNESDYLVMVPKNENGYVSRFAHLVGIEGIKPPGHMEILPYIVTRGEYFKTSPGNPFNDGSEYFSDVGFDLKLGISTNLTLDATINPDFGQVEVDPAVVNLSAYETFYEEKRPFFIEGSNIFEFGRGGATSYWGFNWSNPDFFYSRRIGRPPRGYALHQGYVNMPRRTTILGAVKLSGKIKEGWSLAALNAVTAREYAEIDSSGYLFKNEIEPLTYYAVVRSQRESSEGRYGFGIIGTGVFRNFKDSFLKYILSSRSYSFGIDGWTFLDRNKSWVITGWAGGSRVEGEREVILALQQAPQRYYQRPDAEHLGIDSSAISLNGWGARFVLNKEKGNVIFNAGLGAISPGFDTNDMGFFWRGDVLNGHISAGYFWSRPGKIFRSKSINLATFRNYDFGSTKTGEGYFIFMNGQLLNYWGFMGSFGLNPGTVSTRATRGGPIMKNPGFRFLNVHGYSDRRKSLVLMYGGSYGGSDDGSYNWRINAGITIKPNSRFRIRLNPNYSQNHTVTQWVIKYDDPAAAQTYGTRYVFSQLDQKSISMSTRFNWTFTPKLSLQLYMHPLLSIGDYHGFKEFSMPGTYRFREYGSDGSTINYSNNTYNVDPDDEGPIDPFSFVNPDFNFKSLRGTAILRWEYQPGSILYIVWTQDRTNLENPGDFSLRRDVSNLMSSNSDNVFLIKVTYWWNP